MLTVITSHRFAPVQEQVEEDLSYLIIVCIMREARVSHFINSLGIGGVSNMALATLSTITTILGTIIAVATFWYGYWQYKRSVNIEIFRTYADKYNEIIIAEKYDKWEAALSGEKDY